MRLSLTHAGNAVHVVRRACGGLADRRGEIRPLHKKADQPTAELALS
jgi:hypothetical protein